MQFFRMRLLQKLPLFVLVVKGSVQLITPVVLYLVVTSFIAVLLDTLVTTACVSKPSWNFQQPCWSHPRTTL